MNLTTYSLEVFCQKVGLGKDEILSYVKNRIISPHDQDNLIFDQEDYTRVALILELKENCNPNDESIEVMLHLIDQIHFLQNKLLHSKLKK